MRSDILEKKSQILIWIDENKSKAFIAKELGCKQETLNKYLEKIKENKFSILDTIKDVANEEPKMTLEDYLENSEDIQTNKVRKKILEEGLKPHRCECCGLEEWMGKPIPLELHHKDGDRHHNELENYELLCPNCHAFTDSYRGKNSRK